MRKHKFKPGDRVQVFSIQRWDSPFNQLSELISGCYGIISRIEIDSRAKPRCGAPRRGRRNTAGLRHLKSRNQRTWRCKIRGCRRIIRVRIAERPDPAIVGVDVTGGFQWRIVFCGVATIEELVTHIDPEVRELGLKRAKKKV